jgi:simple sugar transport system substrate-binding protein
LAGTWTGNRQMLWGIKEGLVVLSPLNPSVPAEAAKLFEAKKQAIIAGSLLPFAGPIKDNMGKLRVADGQVMPLPEMMAINWYVEGVEGSIPK